MRLEIFDKPFSTDNDNRYHQNIMRLVNDDGLRFQIALKIPQRVFGDRKSVSAKQRSTIDGFFFDHDITPKECGWQQADRPPLSGPH